MEYFIIGSGMLIKSSVLEEINGFPVNSTTEDFNFSFSIHTLGYRSLYLDEPLQLGLTPDSLTGTIEQYKRWEIGNFQVVCHRFRELFSLKEEENRMTYFQRFVYLTFGIRVTYCLTQLFFMTFTLLSLWVNLPYVMLNNRTVIKITLITSWVQYIFNRLILYILLYDVPRTCDASDWMAADAIEESNRSSPFLSVLQLAERTLQKAAWTAPFYCYGLLSMLIKIPPKFIATRSYASVYEERKHLFHLALNLSVKGFIFHVIYILLAIGGIIYRLTRTNLGNLAQSLWLITLVAVNIYSLTPPIWFILFPPPNRERKDLLTYQKDETTGETKVRLKAHVSLYPTSKRTILLVFFPLLIIAIAVVNIILLFTSPRFLQSFLIQRNTTTEHSERPRL